MTSSLVDLSVIGLCWALALILPHFQTTPSAWELVGDVIIFGVLSAYTFRVLSSSLSRNTKIKTIIASLSFGGFGIGFLLSNIGNSSFYDVWSHLGAGTMKLDGEVYIFGDLTHLTSAASCSLPIIISTNVYDPWGRLFNQNPEIGEFFRLFHLTNLNLVGIVSTFVFILCLGISIKKFRVKNLSLYLMTLTPVFVLALDRGNELITMSLILVGVVCFHRDQGRLQILGSMALLFAVFFKIWPIYLVFFSLIFQWKLIKNSSKLILFLPFIYLAVKFGELRAIVNATQGGSPFGTSFGLSLFANSQLNTIQLAILVTTTLMVTLTLIGLGSQPFESFIKSNSGQKTIPWVLPLMLTYCAVWATGESFIYRMVILIPLVLILSGEEVSDFRWSRITVAAILVASITSRLPITISATSGLALYFCFIGIKTWQVRTSALRR